MALRHSKIRSNDEVIINWVENYIPLGQDKNRNIPVISAKIIMKFTHRTESYSTSFGKICNLNENRFDTE